MALKLGRTEKESSGIRKIIEDSGYSILNDCNIRNVKPPIEMVNLVNFEKEPPSSDET